MVQLARVELENRLGGFNFHDPPVGPRPGHVEVHHRWGITPLHVGPASRKRLYEEYHPYGTSSYRSFTSPNVSDKRYRYTGKERDEETGLYYHGARYYAAWLGRWTAADPMGTVDGTNLYAYVRGSPVVLHDPNGAYPAATDLPATNEAERRGNRGAARGLFDLAVDQFKVAVQSALQLGTPLKLQSGLNEDVEQLAERVKVGPPKDDFGKGAYEGAQAAVQTAEVASAVVGGVQAARSAVKTVGRNWGAIKRMLGLRGKGKGGPSSGTGTRASREPAAGRSQAPEAGKSSPDPAGTSQDTKALVPPKGRVIVRPEARTLAAKSPAEARKLENLTSTAEQLSERGFHAVVRGEGHDVGELAFKPVGGPGELVLAESKRLTNPTRRAVQTALEKGTKQGGTVVIDATASGTTPETFEQAWGTFLRTSAEARSRSGRPGAHGQVVFLHGKYGTTTRNY